MAVHPGVATILHPKSNATVGFKHPTPVELAHDFLWRIYPHTPALGEVAIFNRSHYEDVLVTRVHKRIDKKTWTARLANPRIRDRADRKQHGRAEILPAHQQARTTCALRRAPGRPGPQLEDQLRIGLQRAGALGRLYRRVRRRDQRHQYTRGAVVSNSGKPQVVPQSGGVTDHGGYDGRA